MNRPLPAPGPASISVCLFAALVAAVTGCREGVLAGVNHAPVVQSVLATPDEVFTGQEVILRVEATDEDGDGIRYFWAAESGSFDNVVGESVRWTAPAFGGQHEVQVNASDRVASTNARVWVRVRPSQRPVQEGASALP